MSTRMAIVGVCAALAGQAALAADPTPGAPMAASEPRSPPARAEEQAAGTAADAATAGFDNLDTNGNGSIDRTEARYLPKLAQQFDRWDGDRSGSVNALEFRKFMDQPS